MAIHSSTLACRIPWAEEPGGLRSQRVGHGGPQPQRPSLCLGVPAGLPAGLCLPAWVVFAGTCVSVCSVRPLVHLHVCVGLHLCVCVAGREPRWTHPWRSPSVIPRASASPCARNLYDTARVCAWQGSPDTMPPRAPECDSSGSPRPWDMCGLASRGHQQLLPPHPAPAQPPCPGHPDSWLRDRAEVRAELTASFSLLAKHDPQAYESDSKAGAMGTNPQGQRTGNEMTMDKICQ